MEISESEARWIARICHAIVPRGLHPDMPYGAADFDFEGFIIDLLRHYPPLSALGVRACMFLFNVGPLLFIGRPSLFTNLSAHDQARYYDRWYDSPNYYVRQLASLVKMIACLGFFGQPEVQRRIGYVKPNQDPPLGARPADYRPQTSDGVGGAQAAGGQHG